MKTYFLFLAVLILTSLSAMKAMADNKAVACPMIAKLCADGSSVSPQGPHCEIPACPGGDPTLKNAPDRDCTGDDCEGKATDEEND